MRQKSEPLARHASEVSLSDQKIWMGNMGVRSSAAITIVSVAIGIVWGLWGPASSETASKSQEQRSTHLEKRTESNGQVTKSDSQPIERRSEPAIQDFRHQDLQVARPVERGRTLTTREIVERSEASVAQVKGARGSGSGFLVRHRLLATNHHVICDELCKNIELYFPSAANGERGSRRAELLYEDAKRDLAIFHVDTTREPLELAEAYTFRKGDDVTIIGSPGIGPGLALQNAITRGVVSTETTIDGAKFYQLGASVNPGNSGGPVIDSDGKVIGVVSAKAQKAEAVGFCIPVQDLMDALRSEKVVALERDPKTEKTHNARVVFTVLGMTGYMYERGMNKYVSDMRATLLSGGSAAQGISMASRAVDPVLARFDTAITADIKEELSSIVNDTEIPFEVREELKDLWAVYREMKSYIDEPRGSFESYSKKSIELKDRYEHLVNGLGLLLGT